MRAVRCRNCGKWISAGDAYCRHCKDSWIPSPLCKCGFGMDNCKCKEIAEIKEGK